MHTILVINCGSSSIKYEVYRMPDRESIGKGLIERIGQDMGHICQKRPDGKVYDSNAPMPDHKAAMEHLKSALIDGEAGLISSMAENPRCGTPGGTRGRGVFHLRHHR